MVQLMLLLVVNEDEVQTIHEGLQGGSDSVLLVHLLLPITAARIHLASPSPFLNLTLREHPDEPCVTLATTKSLHFLRDNPTDQRT